MWGAVLAANGSTIAPGSSPGILGTGNITFAGGSTFDVEINGAVPGAGGHDQLDVTGSVTINAGAVLNPTLGFLPEVGDEVLLIRNDGTDAISGQFDGFADDATVTLGGYDFAVDYQGGDGNDFSLTALPMSLH